ncbi:DEAD/DEAH box helicase [Parasalinivibrio latis]|uniref:DEAD/DEAH box helicase n=1 Tax=Parasalinivibrio latis TaxID=2952610 RepID=UPI0030DEF833
MQETTITFSELNLSASILEALNEMGFTNPTPIQAAAIPALLEGQDALGKAQTGTGKTAAFSLPILNGLNLDETDPQAIVLAPTRELAIQVADEMKRLGAKIPGLRVLEIYGGTSIVDQLRALNRGAHVVVGTPGRIKDLITRQRLRLENINTFVLDEADEMLKMGFVDDVTWIMEQAPENAQRVLFSATMPPIVKEIVDRFLRNPARIDVAGSNRTVAKVEQKFWVQRGVDKNEAMIRLLETEDTDASIVFVRTRQDTEQVSDFLAARGFKSAPLHGDIPQNLRERTVEQLKSGVIDILVATDVVARGLDVARVTHVFNYDIPFDVESYIHRIGRTGRAGREGKAILLVKTNQMRMLRTIERVTQTRMDELKLPLLTEVAARRLDKLADSLVAESDTADLETFVGLINTLSERVEMDSTKLAALLLKRCQGPRPLVVNGDNDPMLHAKREPRERGDRFDRGDRRRGDRFERGERGDRGERRPSRKFQNNDMNWNTYQLQVGREHGVQARDVVGAIANELGLEKQFIGAIRINQEVTNVDLPQDMPGEIFEQLKGIRIRQRPTRARLLGQSERGNEERPRRRFNNGEGRGEGRPARDRGERSDRGDRGERRRAPRNVNA